MTWYSCNMDHLVLNNNNHSLTQTYFKTRSMAMSYTFCLGEIQYTPSTKRFLYCLISFRSVFFHSTTMQLLEQELLTLPEHMSSPSVFNGGWLVGWGGRSLVLCVMFCRSLFVFFPLAIVLSVILWSTVSSNTSSNICSTLHVYFLHVFQILLVYKIPYRFTFYRLNILYKETWNGRDMFLLFINRINGKYEW